MNRIVLLVLCFMLPGLSAAQTVLKRTFNYRIEDWVTYKDTRFITSVARGDEYAYYGSTGGVLKWNFNQDQWELPYTVSSGLPDDDVQSLAFDSNTNYLWVASATAVSFLEPASDEFRVIFYDQLGDGPVVAMGSGVNDFWFKTGRQIFKGHRMGGPFWPAEGAAAQEDQVIWQGSGIGSQAIPELYPDGDYHYFPPTTLQDFHGRRYEITSAAKDRFQRMWVGVWGLGPGRVDLRSQVLTLMPFGPWVRSVRAMGWSPTGMWVGGESRGRRPGGVSHWDWEEDSWEVFEAALNTQLRSDRVRAIDGAGRFTWFGTDQGVMAFDEERRDWRYWGVRDNLWSDQVNYLTLGPGGLWIATEAGLNLLDTNTYMIRRIRHDQILHRRIWCVEADTADVWVGSERGLLRFLGDQGVMKHIARPAGMMYMDVTALSVSSGELWAGTDDGIMMRNQSNGEWTLFPAHQWGVEGFVHSIFADEQMVWAGTDQGLLAYYRDDNRWRRFTMEDGLPDDRVYCILADGDYLWLGTGNGITRFYWNAPYRID